jgi:hypothetical protein
MTLRGLSKKIAKLAKKHPGKRIEWISSYFRPDDLSNVRYVEIDLHEGKSLKIKLEVK